MFKNYGKTALLLAALGGLTIAIGSLFGQGGLYIGFALGLVLVGGSYWFSDKLAIASARGVAVTREEAPDYYRIVEDLTQRANLPMPRLYIAPSDQPNAFATGRNPEHAAVAATEGILQLLTDDELEGVLAHELAHVKHRDILISSVAATMAGAIIMIARFAMFIEELIVLLLIK